MAIRSFIFCDACNPQGIRTINDGFQYGRRNDDGRTWYEGDICEASECGWVSNAEGHHLCPKCHARGLGEILAETHVQTPHHAIPLLRCA
ncbi:hypothetical protein [Sulfuriflexus mobilis]|uniref:hypothetical protein n=1 Tax=Sulfuriflexus mobilis TaxID=1811807 RepID=UPI000F83296C|nr:hypothetical protein [Sulfuriflexus mobilis]